MDTSVAHTELDPLGHQSLAGRRVVLEPLEPAHTPALIDAALEGRSMFEELGTSSLRSEHDVRAWAQDQLRHQRDVNDLPFVVLDAGTGQALGAVWIADIRPRHARTKLGQLWFQPDEPRSDEALEALLLASRHIVDSGYCRIGMHAALDDPATAELLERLGATREGILRDWLARRGGERVDVTVYSLLAEEYDAATAAAWEAVGGRPTADEQAATEQMLTAARGESVELPLPQRG